MTEKRFTTNGYYIYDQFKEDRWLVNEVEAQEIVDIMNNLDTKARERSKALSKLQKKNEQLKKALKDCEHRITDKEVEWLRENTVWEQMPSSKRIVTKTTKE